MGLSLTGSEAVGLENMEPVGQRVWFLSSNLFSDTVRSRISTKRDNSDGTHHITFALQILSMSGRRKPN